MSASGPQTRSPPIWQRRREALPTPRSNRTKQAWTRQGGQARDALNARGIFLGLHHRLQEQHERSPVLTSTRRSCWGSPATALPPDFSVETVRPDHRPVERLFCGARPVGIAQRVRADVVDLFEAAVVVVVGAERTSTDCPTRMKPTSLGLGLDQDACATPPARSPSPALLGRPPADRVDPDVLDAAFHRRLQHGPAQLVVPDHQLVISCASSVWRRDSSATASCRNRLRRSGRPAAGR